MTCHTKEGNFDVPQLISGTIFGSGTINCMAGQPNAECLPTQLSTLLKFYATTALIPGGDVPQLPDCISNHCSVFFISRAMAMMVIFTHEKICTINALRCFSMVQLRESTLLTNWWWDIIQDISMYSYVNSVVGRMCSHEDMTWMRVKWKGYFTFPGSFICQILKHSGSCSGVPGTNGWVLKSTVIHPQDHRTTWCNRRAISSDLFTPVPGILENLLYSAYYTTIYTYTAFYCYGPWISSSL